MKLEHIQKNIGYQYKNEKLLITALTHSSYANEKKVQNNERLEFLGDSVLNIIISDYIYKKMSNLSEGKLSKIRAALVCEQSLAEIAKKINLGDAIFLGHGEEITGGRKRSSVVSDAFEAVLASIYLDGGIEIARSWLLSLMQNEIDQSLSTGTIKDYKTQLQELIQKKGSVHKICYKIVAESGQDHNKTFKTSVIVDDKTLEYGVGSSKKEAEQRAAEAALKKLL